MEGILVQNLFKSYGSKNNTLFAALKGIEMHLGKGEYVALVGESGSGTLNPMLSVYHNVEEALVNLTDLSSKQRKERIYELMELTNMNSQLMKVPTKQLSGGEQRRFSLLRALSIRPDYLILDEVISGLDLISADAVMRVLEKYHQEYACTCLFITHDQDSAYHIADRILEIKHGKIIREGVKMPRKENRNEEKQMDKITGSYHVYSDAQCYIGGLLQQ